MMTTGWRSRATDCARPGTRALARLKEHGRLQRRFVSRPTGVVVMGIASRYGDNLVYQRV
eukprot:1896284-Pyramimonas_sp.AAC.3